MSGRRWFAVFCSRACRVSIRLPEKHWWHDDPERMVWKAMRQRCNNPSATGFSDYGGRGIKVCERWDSSYANFLADMGRRPSAKHSLDRINNDGNYEPGNCRWVTWSEQMRNRRIGTARPESAQCVQCGRTYARGSRLRRYCSPSCSHAFRAGRPALPRNVACVGCGSIFEQKCVSKIYCSQKCNWTTHNRARPKKRVRIPLT
jgi:hypothetical protein